MLPLLYRQTQLRGVCARFPTLDVQFHQRQRNQWDFSPFSLFLLLFPVPFQRFRRQRGKHKALHKWKTQRSKRVLAQHHTFPFALPPGDRAQINSNYTPSHSQRILPGVWEQQKVGNRGLKQQEER